jgi:nitroreductase
MDTFELLTGRRTVHDYAAEQLPSGALTRAFSCAIAAPNHRLTEPWRFVVAGQKAREQLVEVSLQLKTPPGAEPRPELVANTRRKMLTPAELVVVSVVRQVDPAVAREDYAAVACAIQNFCLSLWAEGVGSKWSTGAITSAAQTYQIVGIDSEREEIVGFVWAGMASGVPPKAKRRLQLTDVVRQVP